MARNRCARSRADRCQPSGSLGSLHCWTWYGPPIEALLRQHGLRVTAQRLAVLRAVSSTPHATADAVAEIVRAEIGSISTQAVYDVLAALTEKRLLRRIQPRGSPVRYEARVGDNHHHLICRVCNRMVDVECAVGDTPCLTASEDAGFVIDEAEVLFWGRCPDCRTTPGGAAEQADHHQTSRSPAARRMEGAT